MTDKERIEAIKQKAKRNSYQLAILSFIGVFGFLIAWQAAVLVGWLPSRYVPMPTQIIKLFFVKIADPTPDGAVLGVHILGSLQVVLTGFLLAIIIGIPLRPINGMV